MNNNSFNLLERKENVREQKQEVVLFEIADIKKHFEENIDVIENLFNLAEQLEKKDEAMEIWRSQVVFLDSAFDFFLHEITKLGMSNIYRGSWEKTDKFRNYPIPMDIVMEMESSDERINVLLEHINERISKDTYMSYTSFKEQLNFIGISIEKIAKNCYYEQGSDDNVVEKLKEKINNLFKRRNLIAHQSDRLHIDAKRQLITKEEVECFFDDIKRIVDCICDEIESKSTQPT